MSFSPTPAKLVRLAVLPLLLAALGCAQLRTWHQQHLQHRKPSAPAPAAAAPAEPEIDPNLPAPGAPPAPPPARPPEPPAKVILEGVWLRPVAGGWKLDPKGLAVVQQAAGKVLAFGPRLRVVVNGYTSAAGNRAQNLALSHRRAEVVEKALIRAGVPAGQIVARGLGPDQPLASNATPAGRLRNLRVEVEFQAR